MERLKKAIDITTIAHAGQLDQIGHPYILHPMVVMDLLKEAGNGAGPTEDEMIVAVLHDIIEDVVHKIPGFTPPEGTTTSIREAALDFFTDEFGLVVSEALSFLHHSKHQPYQEYILRLATNPISIKVKRADLRHNGDPKRLMQIVDVKTRERLEKKYAMALVLIADK